MIPGTTSAVEKSVRVRGVVLADGWAVRVNVINNIIILYEMRVGYELLCAYLRGCHVSVEH